MRLLILFLSCMGLASLCCNAQYYYNPYQQQYNQNSAYEWGRKLAEEQKAQQEAIDARSVNGCFNRIGKAIARRNFDEAEEWAEKMLDVRKSYGYYFLGLVNELQGYGNYAKSYYQKGAKINNKACKNELERIAKYGYATDSQIDNVVNYFVQLEAVSYNMAAQISTNIWGNSSSTSSSYYETSPNRSRATQKANCSICHGTGIDPTPYTHSASADSYHNYAGYSCPYCGKATNHYHYRCRH